MVKVPRLANGNIDVESLSIREPGTRKVDYQLYSDGDTSLVEIVKAVVAFQYAELINAEMVEVMAAAARARAREGL